MKKYILLFVAITVLGGGWYFTERSFLTETNFAPSFEQDPIATTTDGAKIRAVAPSTTKLASAPQATPSAGVVAAPTSAPPAPAKKSTASLHIAEASYELYANPGSTVLEAMRMLASTSNFTFDGHEYPSLGYFVESINGKKAVSGYVWIFYVNGKESKNGISQTTLSEGDSVEWKYEKSY